MIFKRIRASIIALMSVAATIVQRRGHGTSSKVDEYFDGPGTSAGPGRGGDKSKVRLTWENMTYVVNLRHGKVGETKTILNGVNGYVEAGELLAVMGPSGSGKTTLLDTLADRAGQGVLTGSVRVNGMDRGASFTKFARYVPQEDSLMGVLSPREVLMYAAEFTLPGVSKQAQQAKVAAAIRSMGLMTCQDQRIGDLFFKGITSGQKRRVSMAIHLLSTPAIMILDEPTSGLDSAASMGVFEVIKRLATDDKEAVLFTVHQPPSEMFRAFDKLMLLAAGRVAYYGRAEDMVVYFSGIGYECPVFSNPADYALGLINDDFEGHADIQMITNAFAESKNLSTLRLQLTSQSNEGYHHVDEFDSFLSKSENSSRFGKEWYQFKILLRRAGINAVRNPGLYGVRLVLYIMLSFMIGTMYWDLGNDFSTIQDRSALIAYVGSFLVFLSIAVVPFFIEFRAVFILETKNNFYHVSPYVLAHYLVGLPGIGVIALVSSALIYYPAGMHDGRFFVFFLNLFLSLTTAEAFMSFMSAIAPHYIVGMAVAAGVYGMFMLSQGFLVLLDNMPDAWIWSYYIAFHSYQYRVFMYNEFHDLKFVGAGSEFYNNTGDGFLRHLDIDDVDIPVDLFIQFLFGVLFEVLFFVALKYLHTGKR